MTKLMLSIVGAAAFVAIHLVIVAMWQTWFGGSAAYAPWFLNASSTVAFTTAVFASINLLAAVLSADGRIEARFVAAALIAAGAALPMIVILFMTRGGPGTLFPIAITIGLALIFLGGVAGGWLGWVIRFARPRSLPRDAVKTDSDS
jgi:hypothetical protein